MTFTSPGAKISRASSSSIRYSISVFTVGFPQTHEQDSNGLRVGQFEHGSPMPDKRRYRKLEVPELDLSGNATNRGLVSEIAEGGFSDQDSGQIF